jgi:hypothetical protein
MKANGIACMNKTKQLQLGWIMYANDSQDRIVPNANDPISASWVYGTMSPGTDQTNVQKIMSGLLWPYANNTKIYKCPSDPKKHSSGEPTVRSISMNAWLNPVRRPCPPDQNYAGVCRVFRKQSDFNTAISSSKCWVFIDENDATINDAYFLIDADVVDGPNKNIWPDVPASYHGRAGGLSFADGHSETRKWRDKTVLSRLTAGQNFIAADPMGLPATFADLRWIQERSSVPQ